ncbi:MAG: HEAT repeat domain-containing protein [Myxococcales bacterium]|nr:HEAT repeat domain-containing protein [Myxococcales bacterium]
MRGGTTGRRAALILGGVFTVSAVCTALLARPSAPARGPRVPPAARPVDAARAPAAAAACRWAVGDAAAFRLASVLTVEGQTDRFEATLSWEVVAAAADGARVRAALSQVVHTQDLTQPAERAASPEGVPFYLDLDAACRITAAAYAPAWDARTRLLVQTQLDSHAFALPQGQAAWREAGRDGLGAYTALFRVTGQTPLTTVARQKAAHAPRGDGARLGIDLRIERAEAVATFDPAHPAWWHSTRGEETVAVTVEGQPPLTLHQRFSLARADERFAPVAPLAFARADGQDPYTLPVAVAAPAPTYATLEEAWAAFSAQRAAGDELAAAHALAGWLKAHPEAVGPLAQRLRAGADPATHPALFLALELSGTDAARDALTGLVDDAALSPLDQARAVSALADCGPPSQAVADRLLARAEGDDLAAGVSLLAVGAMAGRAEDDALRGALNDALAARLAAAPDEAAVHRALDALGNSGDPAFAEALGDALAADSATTRRHAAEALARLPGEAAAPRLLDGLRDEASPRVATALVKALGATGQRPDGALDVMAARLAAGDAQERAAVIAWLGQGGEAESQLLAAHFHREPSARLKQQIGRYVPASALR